MSDLEKRIRERAYEIWENEGRPAGRGDEHWAMARAEFAEAVSDTGAPPRKPSVSKTPKTAAAKTAAKAPQAAPPRKNKPTGEAVKAKVTAKTVSESRSSANEKATVKRRAATRGRKPK